MTTRPLAGLLFASVICSGGCDGEPAPDVAACKRAVKGCGGRFSVRVLCERTSACTHDGVSYSCQRDRPCMAPPGTIEVDLSGQLFGFEVVNLDIRAVYLPSIEFLFEAELDGFEGQYVQIDPLELGGTRSGIRFRFPGHTGQPRKLEIRSTASTAIAMDPVLLDGECIASTHEVCGVHPKWVWNSNLGTTPMVGSGRGSTRLRLRRRRIPRQPPRRRVPRRRLGGRGRRQPDRRLCR